MINSVNNAEVIKALLLCLHITGKSRGVIRASRKARGHFAFPITIGRNFSPIELHASKTVKRSLESFPPAHISCLAAKVRDGSCLKKSPVSSALNIFRSSYPAHILGRRSFQESTAFVSKS